MARKIPVRSRKKTVRRKKLQKNRTRTYWWDDRKLLYALLGILVLTFVIYSPTFKNQWTNWDDDLYVGENLLVSKLSSENVSKIFDKKTFVAGNYHPVTILSLAFNYSMTGMDISSYQWTNILLHLLNTFLVFFFVYELTSKKKEVAIITALLFAIHPMHVESVSWIAERKDVLYTAFFLPGLIFYGRYIKNGKWGTYSLSVIFFALSVLSKPAAVVFPLCLVIIDLFKRRQINVKSILDKAPFFIGALIMGLHTIRAQAAANAYGGFETVYSLMDRLFLASYGFVMYIVRFIVPFKLSAFYPYPKGGVIPDVYKVCTVLVIALLAWVFWKYKKTRVPFLAIGFYGATVALVLQFISVGDAILADRYTYVPYIGLGILAGYGYYWLINKKSALAKQMKKPVMVGLIIIAGIFSYLTFERTQVWENTETLFTNVVNNYPTAVIAYNNRGHYYRQNNRLEEALADYNKALEINPKYQLAFSNKGKVYFEYKQYDIALENYNEALRLKPNDVPSLANRAAVLGLLNNYPAAMTDLNKAVELDPSYPEAFYNRGILFLETRRFPEAISDFSRYLELRPYDDEIVNTRGVCYQRNEDQNMAIVNFNQAIQMAPSNGIYYMNRSFSYNILGDKSRALLDARKAISLGTQVDQNYFRSIGG